MRFAVLILFHKNFDQLARLVESLKHEEVDVYIHIDKKTRYSISDIKRIKEVNTNTYFCDKNHNIHLFSFEMVEATLSMIKYANNIIKQKNTNYSYYMLISGQDYLIKSVDKIIEELKVIYPKPLIDTTPIFKGNWVYKSFNKSNCFKKQKAFLHLKLNKITNKYIRYIYKCFTIGVLKLISLVKVSPRKRLKKVGVQMFGGSQWWILSDICINSILKINSNMNLSNVFKYVGSPDETFFQTCLMNTECKNMVDVNNIDEVRQNCMTYTIFNDDGHPIYLTNDNFDKVMSSNKYFARKFDVNLDNNVLDRIDKEILADSKVR